MQTKYTVLNDLKAALAARLKAEKQIEMAHGKLERKVQALLNKYNENNVYHAVSITWWDHLANTEEGNPCRILENYMIKYDMNQPVNVVELHECLCELGYSDIAAYKKSRRAERALEDTNETT